MLQCCASATSQITTGDLFVNSYYLSNVTNYSPKAFIILSQNAYKFPFICRYVTNYSRKDKPFFYSTIVTLFSMQSVLGSTQSLTDGFLNLQLLQQVCTYY